MDIKKETAIEQITLVGAGVIGGGWAARFLAYGLQVTVCDPAQNAHKRLQQDILTAIPALKEQGFSMADWESRLIWEPDLKKAVVKADFVQESAPEREELKTKLLAEIDAYTRPEVLIASSSSGLLPTAIQSACLHPERVLIAHPFNPVYLLPLVELVGGDKTVPETLTQAAHFFKQVGMRPLIVRKEIEGYLADRLMEALWREALHLINDDIATTEEVDAAIVYGAGLRWALMGTFLTFHLAGGEAGMRHMLEQFGPALKLPWTHTIAPELTPDLIDKVVAGCEEQAAGRSVAELVNRRDEFLVKLLELVEDYWPENEGRQRAI